MRPGIGHSGNNHPLQGMYLVQAYTLYACTKYIHVIVNMYTNKFILVYVIIRTYVRAHFNILDKLRLVSL